MRCIHPLCWQLFWGCYRAAIYPHSIRPYAPAHPHAQSPKLSHPPCPPQTSSGTTKLAAERTLARTLRADTAGSGPAEAFLAGGSAGGLARTQLSEAYLRRLCKLPPGGDDDDGYDV